MDPIQQSNGCQEERIVRRIKLEETNFKIRRIGNNFTIFINFTFFSRWMKLKSR